MRDSMSRGWIALFSAAVFLAACQSFETLSSGSVSALLNRGAPGAGIRFARLRPSHAWRKYGHIKRLLTFPTQIQHVVVIVMENRTVDDLLAGYYSQAWTGPGGGTWGSALDLHNPAAQPTLLQNSLSANFNPNHAHNGGWQYEIDGSPKPIKGCPGLPCPPTATVYSYVPMTEAGPYAQLIKNWAFADNVLQANEGPSFPAHQYFIAGQSGGLGLSSPDSEAENPGDPPTADPTGDYVETNNDIDMMSTSGCNPSSGYSTRTVDMTIPAPSPTHEILELDNGKKLKPPCEEYNTILDAMERLGKPPIFDWQYIAHSDTSIWAAPLGVQHIYNCWLQGNPENCAFFVDPNAIEFVQNLTSPGPSPTPFAALTYITPCLHESDHPALSGSDDGPQWAAWLINAIGQSQYWNSTAIILVWDDWGGWYDHEPAPTPFRPPFNKYSNNPADPYEWGYRVPMIVISPYITERGYISHNGLMDVPQWRSQSVILQLLEGIFDLSPLGTDDYQNSQTDGLVDMFQPLGTPLPYVTVPTSFTPGPAGTCPAKGAPSYRRMPRHRRGAPQRTPSPRYRSELESKW